MKPIEAKYEDLKQAYDELRAKYDEATSANAALVVRIETAIGRITELEEQLGFQRQPAPTLKWFRNREGELLDMLDDSMKVKQDLLARIAELEEELATKPDLKCMAWADDKGNVITAQAKESFGGVEYRIPLYAAQWTKPMIDKIHADAEKITGKLRGPLPAD